MEKELWLPRRGSPQRRSRVASQPRRRRRRRRRPRSGSSASTLIIVEQKAGGCCAGLFLSVSFAYSSCVMFRPREAREPAALRAPDPRCTRTPQASVHRGHHARSRFPQARLSPRLGWSFAWGFLVQMDKSPRNGRGPPTYKAPSMPIASRSRKPWIHSALRYFAVRRAELFDSN
jgi:hypothetical protein